VGHDDNGVWFGTLADLRFMTTSARDAVPVRAIMAILLILSAASSSACASVGLNSSGSQLTPRVKGAAMIPGSLDQIAALQLRS
jgi:hypothetical protein